MAGKRKGDVPAGKRKLEAAMLEGRLPNAKERARNRASPCGLVKLYDHLNNGQKAAIVAMDLESMLNIKCRVLSNTLINWLAPKYDRFSRAFVIPGRGRIVLNAQAVYHAMGLPRGEMHVVYGVDKEIESVLAPILFPGLSSTPETTKLFTLLKEVEVADKSFKQMFIMYLDKVDHVKEMNLCQFVCDKLHEQLSIGKLSAACLLCIQFDHRTRTLKFPNGLSVVITPFMIHQVLGTPIGGMQIGEKVDEPLRELIADMMKCKGRFPTISEIDKFITTQLEGVSFKIAFGMYAITAFLCPSSHAAVCPEYIHIFSDPEKIGLFDMSAAVLDKLVSSIEAYNNGTTGVLGGNLLSMVIIYLEFLKADVMPSHLKFKLPRVSIWTAQMVTDIESMDCLSFESVEYGKLPVKLLSDTPFTQTTMESDITASKSYGDLLDFVLSICPEKHRKRVIDELPFIIENMQKDILHTIQPILFQNIINVLKMLPSSDMVDQNTVCRSFQIEEAKFKVPLSQMELQKTTVPLSDCGVQNPHCMYRKLSDLDAREQCSAENAGSDATATVLPSSDSVAQNTGCSSFQIEEAKLKVPLYQFQLVERNSLQQVTVSDCGVQNPVCMGPKLSDVGTRGQCSSENAGGDVTMMEVEAPVSFRDVVRQDSSNEFDVDVNLPEFFFLRVPSLDEERSSFLNMSSMLKIIDSLPVEDLSSIPTHPHLLEEMLPQKVEINSEYEATPPVLDLLSYILEEAAAESKVWKLMTGKVCSVDEKVEVYNELFTSSPAGFSFNVKKRVSSTSTNDVTVNCVALKKRARMLEFNSEAQSSPPTTEIPVVCSHDVGQQQLYITHNTSLESNDKHVSKGFTDCGRSDLQASQACAGDGSRYRHNDANPSGYVTVGGTQYKLADPNELSLNWDDESWDKELYEMTLQAEKEYFERKQRNYQFAPPAQNNVRVSEISPSACASSYASRVVEQEVFSDIVFRIPKTAKSKTIHVVSIGSTWAEHRVFGLSMQVYGKVSPYVMNMLGKAVMAEDSERKKFNLLRDGHWKRFYIEVNVAALFQMDHENPGKLARQISNGNIGFMLDTMDLVHLPLYNSGFYYLMVVNFKKNVFQILHPNRKIHLIKDEADIAVKQFKMSFKIAYRNSAINIDAMDTVFQSVCSTERDGDSGVFVMKMICDYNAEKTFWFEPEHAKPIREILTYYMLAHPSNEKMPLETKKILDRHGIAYDYKSPGYTPWKSQESEASSQDSIERMLIF